MFEFKRLKIIHFLLCRVSLVAVGTSGKGNKTGGMMTLLPVKAAEVKSEKGSLRFVPLEAGKWPVLFEEVIGPVIAPHSLN